MYLLTIYLLFLKLFIFLFFQKSQNISNKAQPGSPSSNCNTCKEANVLIQNFYSSENIFLISKYTQPSMDTQTLIQTLLIQKDVLIKSHGKFFNQITRDKLVPSFKHILVTQSLPIDCCFKE